ncbi:MAG TPA: cyclase family protein [Solirubrobacteraceae bacterium]|jgi:kynurenine formamidase|nr:cyclase family protein [Solirubrobacteraceae bacterium]
MARISLEQQLALIRARASAARFGERDRLGSLNTIDAGARARALAAMRSAESVSLSRTIDVAAEPAVELEVSLRELDDEPVTIATERLTIKCHGLTTTHIDGLNHVGYDGTWYSGWPVDDLDGPSVLDWAATGILARGVYLDVAAARGSEWAGAESPVSGADLDAALAASGVELEPGDALIVDMGRDRFESAGNAVMPQRSAAPGAMQPGIGADGAEWIANRDVGLLCWDFLDAVHPDERPYAVHSLLWSNGLVLVDNCDFARLRAASARLGAAVGGLVIAPLALGGGTGSAVNPLFVF